MDSIKLFLMGALLLAAMKKTTAQSTTTENTEFFANDKISSVMTNNMFAMSKEPAISSKISLTTPPQIFSTIPSLTASTLTPKIQISSTIPSLIASTPAPKVRIFSTTLSSLKSTPIPEIQIFSTTPPLIESVPTPTKVQTISTTVSLIPSTPTPKIPALPTTTVASVPAPTPTLLPPVFVKTEPPLVAELPVGVKAAVAAGGVGAMVLIIAVVALSMPIARRCRKRKMVPLHTNTSNDYVKVNAMLLTKQIGAKSTSNIHIAQDGFKGIDNSTKDVEKGEVDGYQNHAYKANDFKVAVDDLKATENSQAVGEEFENTDFTTPQHTISISIINDESFKAALESFTESTDHTPSQPLDGLTASTGHTPPQPPDRTPLQQLSVSVTGTEKAAPQSLGKSIDTKVNFVAEQPSDSDATASTGVVADQTRVSVGNVQTGAIEAALQKSLEKTGDKKTKAALDTPKTADAVKEKEVTKQLLFPQQSSPLIGGVKAAVHSLENEKRRVSAEAGAIKAAVHSMEKEKRRVSVEASAIRAAAHSNKKRRVSVETGAIKAALYSSEKRRVSVEAGAIKVAARSLENEKRRVSAEASTIKTALHGLEKADDKKMNNQPLLKSEVPNGPTPDGVTKAALDNQAVDKPKMPLYPKRISITSPPTGAIKAAAHGLEKTDQAKERLEQKRASVGTVQVDAIKAALEKSDEKKIVLSPKRASAVMAPTSVVKAAARSLEMTDRAKQRRVSLGNVQTVAIEAALQKNFKVTDKAKAKQATAAAISARPTKDNKSAKKPPKKTRNEYTESPSLQQKVPVTKTGALKAALKNLKAPDDSSMEKKAAKSANSNHKAPPGGTKVKAAHKNLEMVDGTKQDEEDEYEYTDYPLPKQKSSSEISNPVSFTKIQGASTKKNKEGDDGYEHTDHFFYKKPPPSNGTDSMALVTNQAYGATTARTIKEEEEYAYTEHDFSIAKAPPRDTSEFNDQMYAIPIQPGKENMANEYTKPSPTPFLSTGDAHINDVELFSNQAYGLVKGQNGEEIEYEYTTPSKVFSTPPGPSKPLGDDPPTTTQNPAYGVLGEMRAEEAVYEYAMPSVNRRQSKVDDVTLSTNQAYGAFSN